MIRGGLLALALASAGCQAPAETAEPPPRPEPRAEAPAPEQTAPRVRQAPPPEAMSLNLADHGFPVMPGMRPDEHDDSSRLEEASGETWLHVEHTTPRSEADVLEFYAGALREARRTATSAWGKTADGKDASVEVGFGEDGTRVTVRLRVK